MAQLHPARAYNHQLVERVIDYLQTRDPRLFPFTARFDRERQRAFIRDLREGLSDLQDSGSARKTSATGEIMSDRRLQEVVREWAIADGDWPHGADPRHPSTSLGAAVEPVRPSPVAAPEPVAAPVVASTKIFGPAT